MLATSTVEAHDLVRRVAVVPDDLAPTYISFGGLDLFLEENLTDADRLAPLELIPAVGQGHHQSHGYRRRYWFSILTNASETRAADCVA